MPLSLAADDADARPNRLNVLRALLADTTNLAKSNKPVQTDLQVLSLIRKRATAGKSAASEFGQAKRDDLKAKEEAQVHVLEEYAGSIETIPEAEIQLAVQRTVESLKRDGGRLDLGTVLKRVLGKDGLLEGRPVETGEVARLVKSSLAS
ncbi:MAG: hypothetical protein M1838_002182 [Thelocarpon superellum]|nr:MAG: hypothetical protein M1838_002182 [Thelocarpon superellum]